MAVKTSTAMIHSKQTRSQLQDEVEAVFSKDRLKPDNDLPAAISIGLLEDVYGFYISTKKPLTTSEMDRLIVIAKLRNLEYWNFSYWQMDACIYIEISSNTLITELK